MDTEIYIDADACPVKDEIIKVATRYQLQVHMVSNSWLSMQVGPLVNKVVVSDGFDAADDWIADNIKENDIAITSDIPLAERCLLAGAKVLGSTGKQFTNNNIGMALSMRALKQDLRDMGEIGGGPPPFSKRDRSNFLQELDKIIQQIKRGR